MVFTFSFCLLHFKQYSLWHRGAVVITSAQFLSTKPERRSCASSSLTCGVSEIRDGEDLWQQFYLEIRLSAFHGSTIPQNNSSSSSSSSSSSRKLFFTCYKIYKTSVCSSLSIVFKTRAHTLELKINFPIYFTFYFNAIFVCNLWTFNTIKIHFMLLVSTLLLS